MGFSWFRRSPPRGGALDAPAAPLVASAEAPALRQPHDLPRIRHLLLLNLQPSDGPAQIERAPALGSRAAVVSTIEAAVPGIRFDGARGAIGEDGQTLVVDLGADDPVPAAVVHAEGDAALERLRALLKHARWRGYAPKAGIFVEPEALELFALTVAGGRVSGDLP